MSWLSQLFRQKESPPGYDELNDRLDRLERHEKLLELEWESTYNKMRSLLARLNKRDERTDAATPSAERASDGNGVTIPGGDAIDRIIALRRGRRE